MESRSMEITLISARDLNNTNILSKTKAYAVAWISNDHRNRQRTPLDKDHGTDPTWNQVMKFNLDEAALQQGRLVLEIAIYADATFGDKEIGHVSIPLNEFLKPAGGNKGATTSAQFVSYQVRKPSGKAKGTINLSVKLAEKPEVKPQAVAGSYGAGKAEPVTAYPAASYGASNAEPVTAYPAYPPAGSSSQPQPYPPQNNQYPPPPYPPQAGYPPPPPHYQGYPQPPYQGYPPNQGYPPYQGYPPVVPAAQQPPRKNNRLGMGLGAGLLGGALGGLLLGDIVSDSYDGGFDGGDFGGGGFDGGF
uniref:C2 domain-containing protein n=1 Tax=Picea sitchensis TaxID=3332 RepID=B8LNV6_PICSI|nr:unknown [Picea sitchensis]